MRRFWIKLRAKQSEMRRKHQEKAKVDESSKNDTEVRPSNLLSIKTEVQKAQTLSNPTYYIQPVAQTQPTYFT